MDATVVTRLEEAGAVLVAKLSTGELARGDRWFGGRTRNPWNLEEGSGGSSAGPGAATAAGLVGFSLGTETLGSIVGPSRTCGVTGLRPTYGVVSRHGVMPAAWSLDKVGPIGRSAEDCALVLSAIAGPDGWDLSLADEPFDWNPNLDVRKLRVGYLADAFAEERTNEAASKENDDRALADLRSLGIELVPVSLPSHADMDALMMLLVEEAAALDELTRSGRDELLIKDREEPEAMLLRAHRLVPGVEYFQLSRVRTRLMEGMARLFEKVDASVAPFLTPEGEPDPPRHERDRPSRGRGPDGLQCQGNADLDAFRGQPVPGRRPPCAGESLSGPDDAPSAPPGDPGHVSTGALN